MPGAMATRLYIGGVEERGERAWVFVVVWSRLRGGVGCAFVFGERARRERRRRMKVGH